MRIDIFMLLLLRSGSCSTLRFRLTYQKIRGFSPPAPLEPTALGAHWLRPRTELRIGDFFAGNISSARNGSRRQLKASSSARVAVPVGRYCGQLYCGHNCSATVLPLMRRCQTFLMSPLLGHRVSVAALQSRAEMPFMNFGRCISFSAFCFRHIVY